VGFEMPEIFFCKKVVGIKIYIVLCHYSNVPSEGGLNYTEEWREQAQRSSGNLPKWKGANTCRPGQNRTEL